MSEVLSPREVFTAQAIRERSRDLATDGYYQVDKHVLAWLETQEDLLDRYVSYAMQRATYWDEALRQLDDER